MENGLQFAKENAKTIESVLKTVSTYFATDYAGIIGLDDSKDEYRIVYRANEINDNLLNKSGFIEKEFIQAMDNTRDEDFSHFSLQETTLIVP